MGTMIDLTTGDGATVGAYRAMPEEKPKGGVVVVQEIYGVNHHIRSVTDRVAAAGYVAIAPALFDRAERGVELAYEPDGMKRGMELAHGIPQEGHLASIAAAIAALAPHGQVGIVGFCLGGTLAYAAAAKSDGLAAAVGYYGGGIAKMVDAEPRPVPRCPFQLHFGEHDGHIPMPDIDKVKAAHPDAPIYTYDAGHGFNCDERGSYDEASATVAWARTLAFLERAMRTA